MSTLPFAGAQRILVGSMSAKLRATMFDQDGNPAIPGALTVDLVRVSTGATIATGRTVTNLGAPNVGQVTADLTAADCALLDVIEATWKDGATVRAVTHHRIVGGFMFSRTDLQALDAMSQFSPAQLDDARDRVTDLFEHCTGMSWCTQFDLWSTSLIGSDVIAVGYRPIRSVRSITVDGTTVALADVEVNADAGVLFDHWFHGVIEVGVEHGMDRPPADLRKAALVAARYDLLGDTSGVSPRARSLSNEFGNINYATAGKDYPTGLPDVDAALARHDHRLPGVG
jgi:hypothetical protein